MNKHCFQADSKAMSEDTSEHFVHSEYIRQQELFFLVDIP